jgi:hypothetical protein
VRLVGFNGPFKIAEFVAHDSSSVWELESRAGRGTLNPDPRKPLSSRFEIS